METTNYISWINPAIRFNTDPIERKRHRAVPKMEKTREALWLDEHLYSDPQIDRGAVSNTFLVAIGFLYRFFGLYIHRGAQACMSLPACPIQPPMV